jgi:hypothetical protein
MDIASDSSPIQTILSASGFHGISPDGLTSGVAGFYRRSGISPCPEESAGKFRAMAEKTKGDGKSLDNLF